MLYSSRVRALDKHAATASMVDLEAFRMARGRASRGRSRGAASVGRGRGARGRRSPDVVVDIWVSTAVPQVLTGNAGTRDYPETQEDESDGGEQRHGPIVNDFRRQAVGEGVSEEDVG